MTEPAKSKRLKSLKIRSSRLILPNEHPVAALREWAKILIPFLALLAAVTAGAIAFAQYHLASGSAERQDRAYLLQDKVEIDLKPDAIPIVRVVVKNYGKTPASNFTVTSECKVVRSSLSGFEKPIEPLTLLNVIIAPGGSSTFFEGCGEPVTQADLEALISHRFAIYFVALVEYRDVFGRLHRTILRRFVGGAAGLLGNSMANSNSPGEGDETD